MTHGLAIAAFATTPSLATVISASFPEKGERCSGWRTTARYDFDPGVGRFVPVKILNRQICVTDPRDGTALYGYLDDHAGDPNGSRPPAPTIR